jgi:hypothetical protein
MSATELFLRAVQHGCLFLAGLMGAYTAWALYRWTTGSPTLVFVLSTGAGALLFAFVGGLVWLTGRQTSYGGSQSTRDIWKGW